MEDIFLLEATYSGTVSARPILLQPSLRLMLQPFHPHFALQLSSGPSTLALHFCCFVIFKLGVFSRHFYAKIQQAFPTPHCHCLFPWRKHRTFFKETQFLSQLGNVSFKRKGRKFLLYLGQKACHKICQVGTRLIY